MHLAQCLVPLGSQIDMSLEEIAAMLKTKTKRFSEEDIRKKFPVSKDNRFDFAMMGQFKWLGMRVVSLVTGRLPSFGAALIEKTE
jgi:hypothetical protein